MEELKRLIEEQARVFKEFMARNDARLAELEKQGHADPLLREALDRIDQEMSARAKQIDALETALARAQLPASEPKDERAPVRAEHRKVFNTWVRRGGDGVGDRLRELQVQAALTTQSDPDGGFLVPQELEARILEVVSQTNAMRGLATVVTIGTSQWEQLVDQLGGGSGWVGESQARTETTTPTLAKVTVPAKEVYAEPKTTQVTLDDAMVDVEAWLARSIGRLFANQEGSGFITGDGASAPSGILSYPTVTNASYAWGSLGYVPSGVADNLTDPDVLISLQHALKSPYRAGSTWLMSDATQAHVRKLKDGDGNYIWRPGLEPGAPDTLLGKPVAIDDTMPSIAAGVYPIAYGNFADGYLIVDRTGIRIIRDNLTSKGNVLFYATQRVGGGVIMFEAIKLLKIATT